MDTIEGIERPGTRRTDPGDNDVDLGPAGLSGLALAEER